MKSTLLFFSFLLSFFCVQIKLQAQSNGSGISGFVFTADNKPAEGASIVLNNTNNGFISTTVADKKGYFVMRELPVGIYTVRTVSYTHLTLPTNREV